MASTYANQADSTIQVLHGIESAWAPCLLTAVGHTRSVASVAYSPDGSRVASSSRDGRVRIWDANGVLIAVLDTPDSLLSVSFSSDGNRVVTGCFDGTVCILEVASGRVLLTLEEQEPLTSLHIPQHGSGVVSGSSKGDLGVWYAANGDCIGLRSVYGKGSVRSAVFLAEGSCMVSWSTDHTVRVWDFTSRSFIAALKGHTGEVRSGAVSRDGSRIAAGSRDGSTRVWSLADPGTHTLLSNPPSHCLWSDHPSEVFSVAFSYDGGRLVSGSNDQYVRVWNTINGQLLRTFQGHAKPVTSVAFSPDGRRIASGSEDMTSKSGMQQQMKESCRHREIRHRGE